MMQIVPKIEDVKIFDIYSKKFTCRSKNRLYIDLPQKLDIYKKLKNIENFV
jgi:hypothetical protein